jgi:diguanylate cyclase (GGDEF)-like protein
MLQSFGIVSAFVAPLFINETFWGFALFEDHRDERYFDDDSADVMRSAALLCANTFIIHEKTQNEKKANEALARRIRYTDALNRMLELCVSRAAESVGAVLGNGLRPVADAASLDRILVFRVKDIGSSNAGEIYRWDRGGGGSAPVDDELKTLPVTAALKRWLIAMANDECVSLRRGEFTEDEAAFLSPRGVRSILIVPIFAEHGLWGFATFHDNAEERDFEDECIDMLRSSARLCTNILQRAEMENAIFNAEKYARELKIEADKIYYDFLTGIYGRRFLDENLNRVIATLFRSGGALSVMMADIDHFKKYNDTYGHDDGDKCLKAVAETLAKSLSRIDDFVVRYGGEEFAIVLPNTDEPGARLVAGRLLENVRKLRIPHEKNDAANCVTISIGVATGNVTGSRGGGEYMKLADEMLYQSKNKGRNRYTLGGL